MVVLQVQISLINIIKAVYFASALYIQKLSYMKIKLFLFPIALLLLSTSLKAQQDTAELIGRWDMTITSEGKQSPSWFEVYRSGYRTLVGEFVGSGGSARPVSVFHFSNGKLQFSLPPQWEGGNNDLNIEGAFNGDSLAGTITYPNGNQATWTAVHAPELKRTSEPSWGQPLKLFNGKDLAGWHALGTNQWVVKGGVLQSPHSGANLATDDTFTDFKLHIEFRYPAHSNSGVYLRGRYEVQIDNSGDEPYKNVISSIYGFIPPSEMPIKGPNEWQSYDITLVGRLVTIVFNGKTVICNREIRGITGGAINSREGEPGPILIQGDHGPIEYRNIVITKAK